MTHLVWGLATFSALLLFMGLAPSSGHPVTIAWTNAFCFALSELCALSAIILAVVAR